MELNMKIEELNINTKMHEIFVKQQAHKDEIQEAQIKSLRSQKEQLFKALQQEIFTKQNQFAETNENFNLKLREEKIEIKKE